MVEKKRECRNSKILMAGLKFSANQKAQLELLCPIRTRPIRTFRPNKNFSAQ